MKTSKNTLQLKNELSNKYANFGKHRKNSHQINLDIKIFQNLDSFAKEDVAVNKKLKSTGKIIRNNTNNIDDSSKKIPNNQNSYQKYLTTNKLLANQPNLIPLKESNMSKPQINTSKVELKSNQAQLKPNFKRNVRSVSSYFEIQYQNLIKQYEKKKQTINQQLESFKNNQATQMQPKYNAPKIDFLLNLQTPKFGSSMLVKSRAPSVKTIKSVSTSKVSKQTRWAIFLGHIKAQIQLQQKLRNFKHEISNQHKQSITLVLKNKYGIQDDITTIDTEEFDPYFQRKNLPIEVISSELADSFLCSQQHWNKNIRNSFDYIILNDIFSIFQNQKQKGVVSLKAFVREMGILLQNHKYLRNRDLYRIYKRIQPFSKDNFIAILSKKE